VAEAAGGAAVSTLHIKLRGVFAGGGTGSGYAIVNTGGRDEATRIGAEIVAGVRLESVHAGHIMVRRGGALERVSLEERTSAQAPSAPAPRYAQAQAPGPRAGAAVAGVAPQPSNPGGGFQRPEPYAPVGDVATEPPQPGAPAGAAGAPQGPRPLSGAPAQGLLIQEVPPGSMLERIGLQAGDVVRSVNGEPVTSEADVARVLQQRGMQGSFTAEVQRGGMTVPIAVSTQR
jgi:general secretion pathway protein C